MARLPLTSAVQPKVLGLLSCLKLCICQSVLLFGVLTNKSRSGNLDFQGKATYRSSNICSSNTKNENGSKLLCPFNIATRHKDSVFWSSLGKVPSCSSVTEWFWHPPEVNCKIFQELNSSGSWKILSWTWNSKWSWVLWRRETCRTAMKPHVLYLIIFSSFGSGGIEVWWKNGGI